MNTQTEIIIKALRVLVNDIQSPDGVPNACVAQAADRLEELQRLNESMQVDRDLWIKVERDEARAEVERLNLELTEAIRERNKTVADLIDQRDNAKTTHADELSTQMLTLISGMNAANAPQIRPDPSRLEIAAMLKAGWFANRDADFAATDHKWWIEQADALIATAREAK